MLLNLRDPVTNRLERPAVGNVVDQENTLGSSEVRSSDRPEAFLSSGVPDLKFDFRAINIDILDLEINSDCRDKSRTKRVVGITEKQTSLTNPGVADHQ